MTEENRIASDTEFSETLSNTGIPLKRLHLQGDVVSSTSVLRWSQYFPNLTKVYIERLKYTTNNIITELTALESLNELTLMELERLEDIAFTASCLDRSSKSKPIVDFSSCSGLF